MATLKLHFPAGRYHATPWGHHVNEGLVEWPPSPWRLIRAFIARGFSSGLWSEPPDLAHQLFNKLAGILPIYRLPATSAAHSRHFMPLGTFGKGREKTTLVFDTWANIGTGELIIHWNCNLTEEEENLFSKLASSLGYLGRSESWVEVALVPDESVPLSDFNAFPCKDGESLNRNHEQVPLMAPIPAEEYFNWQQQVTSKILADLSLPESNKKPSAKLLKTRDKAIAPYPQDLICCLMKDTAWWKGHGWAQPPGSRRVLYWRPANSLQALPPRSVKGRRTDKVSAILLALTTPSGNKSALPSRNRTLPQAELLHRALIGLAGKGLKIHCPELTGRDEFGRPLAADHAHAHVLPLDLDGDKKLDHVILYARMGFREEAQRAIRRLRRTWSKGGSGDIQLAVAGSGDLDLFRLLPRELGEQIGALLGPAEGSRTWESLTPFVPPRHLKARGKNTLCGQVNSELVTRGFPEVESVEINEQLTRDLRHHVCRRNRGGSPPPLSMGFGLRLIFSSPIQGPLLLGYASHFGLGAFRAMNTGTS